MTGCETNFRASIESSSWITKYVLRKPRSITFSMIQMIVFGDAGSRMFFSTVDSLLLLFKFRVNRIIPLLLFLCVLEFSLFLFPEVLPVGDSALLPLFRKSLEDLIAYFLIMLLEVVTVDACA